MLKSISVKVIALLSLMFSFMLPGHEISYADSYKLTIDKDEYSGRFYINAEHYTKKHPDGVTLLYNHLLNKHFPVSKLYYLEIVFKIGKFEVKREDWSKFELIDRRLCRIVKHEEFLIRPPSYNCVPSVLDQLDEEFQMLIYDLVNLEQ